jgi:hypothetical protein
LKANVIYCTVVYKSFQFSGKRFSSKRLIFITTFALQQKSHDYIEHFLLDTNKLIYITFFQTKQLNHIIYFYKKNRLSDVKNSLNVQLTLRDLTWFSFSFILNLFSVCMNCINTVGKLNVRKFYQLNLLLYDNGLFG